LRERRKSFRVEWNSSAKIYDCNDRFVRSCVVSNFSNGGAKIVGIEPATVPDEFILRITPHSPAHKCHVMWRSKEGLGVEFVDNRKAAVEPALGRPQKSVTKRSQAPTTA
jgi:PilZ domain